MILNFKEVFIKLGLNQIQYMTTIRERINAHLPIMLQFISTASLVAIALSAICGSQSLKELTKAHQSNEAVEVHKGHNH